MGTCRLLGALLSTVVIVGAAAGCGGSGSSTSTKTTSSAGGAKAAIRKDWTEFFNGSTQTSQRVSLLQHGQEYKAALTAQSKSPFAQQSSAKVEQVTLTGPSTATVTYSILVAGKPALKNQTGTAVKSGVVWKVADRSFCHLLSLEGAAPPACPKT